MNTEELKNLLSPTMTHNTYEFSDTDLIKTAEFVRKAHDGVNDLMGYPYYQHPYRVCQLVKERFGNAEGYTEEQINFACILALLHDVVEDTKYTAADICLELGLTPKKSEELTYALSFITHDKNKDTYSEYIKKIAEAPIIYPIWVKYADLLDNSSLDRVIISNDNLYLTDKDMNRINKYLVSIRLLRRRIKSNVDHFVCDAESLSAIDKFRTAGEARRLEKMNKK